jgi:outer membrane protein assembly factor BamE (lipoprotein component of BamABCDE complex)
MRVIQLLVCILILSSCATAPTLGERTTLLKVGMTKSEVIEAFGPPKTTSVNNTDEGTIERWSYWTKKVIGYMVFDDPSLSGSGNRLTITFKNDVVQAWGDQLDYTNMMEQNTQAMKEMMKNMPPIQVEQTVYEGDKSDSKPKK